MKLYFLFALIDLLIVLAYPLAYIANRVQKLTGARPARRQG
jgi:hypothetical protein